MFPRRQQPTLAIYFAITVAFLLLGLLYLLQPTTTTRAQSQPEALGMLSGTVHNAQGDPLPNVTVTLEHYKNQYSGRQTTTDATGAYEFLSVLSGDYYLRFGVFEDVEVAPPMIYYPAAYFAEDATRVTVNGNSVGGIDMQMPNTGAISVTIQSTASYTVSNSYFRLFRQAQSGQWKQYHSGSIVENEPNIEIAQLPIGSYRLCVIVYGPPDINAAFECYNNVVPDNEYQVASNATDIVVQVGNVTAVTLAVYDQPQLEGFVTDVNGQPLSAIGVRIRGSQGYPDISTQSNDTGYFSFGFIPTGFYYLIFNNLYYGGGHGGTNGYLPVYYPNAYSSQEAQLLTINASTHLSVTQQLTREARILGKITLPGGDPLSWATILAFKKTAQNTWEYPSCYDFCQIAMYNENTGHFTITQLAAGTYRIQAQHYLNGTQTQLLSYYGGDSLETADDVVVAAGQTRDNINFNMGVGDFDAAIAGTVTADGAPRAGMEVGLFSQSNNNPSESPMPLFSTTTDGDGQYKLEGLAIGVYQVAVRDPQGIYATTFYSKADLYYYAPNYVIITQTGTLENTDIDLLPGGTVRGHIRTQEGKSPSGYVIHLIPADYGDPSYSPLQPYIEVQSDATGAFAVTGLPPGRYFLRALAPDGIPQYPYIRQHYHPSGTDYYFAEILTVERGKTLIDKDIYFFFIPSIFLPKIGGGAIIREAPSAESPAPSPSYPTPTATPAWQR